VSAEPLVDRYLASLPGGLHAHPECEHRGDALGLWLQRSPLHGVAHRLPREIASLLDDPSCLPPWVPEVHASAIYLAIREAHFPDDAAFLAHADRCNRALLDTPMNRLLFWVATPRALLRAVGPRWNVFHRGSALRARTPSDTSTELELSFPEHLFPAIVLRGSATGIAAALENGGAHDVTMDLAQFGPTRARFDGHWQ
jgi:hypothetical protein